MKWILGFCMLFACLSALSVAETFLKPKLFEYVENREELIGIKSTWRYSLEGKLRQRRFSKTTTNYGDGNPCEEGEEFDDFRYQCLKDEQVRFPFTNKRFSSVYIDCFKQKLNPRMYMIFQDGSLGVPIMERVYHYYDYAIVPGTKEALVCFPKEFQQCRKWGLFKDEYTILPNNSLLSLAQEEIHEFKEYAIRKGMAIVCIRSEFPMPESTGVFRQVLFVGWILSQIGLVATFCLHMNCRSKMGSFRMSLLCYTCTMFMAYLSLTLSEVLGAHISLSVYFFIIVMIQFSFLATFAWLNVLCFDIYRDFKALMCQPNGSTSTSANRDVSCYGHKFFWYSIYGWTWPTIISTITIILDFTTLESSPFKPQFVDGHWFSGPMSGIFLFYGPMGLSLGFNILLFCLTVYIILKVTSGNSSTRLQHTKTRWLAALKVFLVMGVSWIFEVLSWANPSSSAVWYVTDLINSLHGVFIFLIFNWAYIVSLFARLKKHWYWNEEEQQLNQAIDGVMEPPPEVQMVQKTTPVNALATDLAKPKSYHQLQHDAENPDVE